jgi:hypothetical protein
MSGYERLGEHPPSADAFDLVSRLAGESGRSLSDFISGGDAIRALDEALRTTNSPTRIYGRRAEEMFGYVVAVLGAASALKREDSGPVIVPEGTSIAVPDYRIVLPDEKEILVEVKNCHLEDPHKPIRLEEAYLRKLVTYGEIFQRPVFVAVYWSRWYVWTLHPVADLLDALARGISLTFLNVLPASHMRVVGDVSLATIYPLMLRLVVDSERVAGTDSESTHHMVIRDVHIFAAGKEIQDKIEKNMAFYLMLNGRWSEEDPKAIMEDGQVSAIEFVCNPEEQDSELNFAIVASASTLASVQFNSLTTTDGEVSRLHVRRISQHPFPKADSQYANSVLPIWRLIMQPSPIKEW